MGAFRNLAAQARQWWADKPARDAEWELWANVPDLEHLRELVAWFCEGKLSFTPGHGGPRCEETEGAVGDALARANRSGFLTMNSQNGGENEYSGQWRSDVEGLADDATAAKLRALVAGTRLCIQVAPLKFFRQDGTVPGSHQKPDGTAYDGNPVLSWRDIAFQFSGIPSDVLSQVTRLNYVQIVDPKWGPSTLLWERLAEPDWDNPTPPTSSLADEDTTMPAHIPPGREDLWRRQEEANAEVRHLTALYEAADRRADGLNRVYPAYHQLVRDADAETERINAELDQAEAVAERIHQERTAGLSFWIDHDPTAPICSECGGMGGPPGSDAHSACTTCRGWGREDDGRPPIPVWNDKDQQWINPATGQPVDLLADPAPEGWGVAETGTADGNDGPGHAPVDMPPAAQPYTPPPRREEPDTAQGAQHMSVIEWVRDTFDRFLIRLFQGWGFEDSDVVIPGQAITGRQAKQITAHVDAARARQAAPPAPPPDEPPSVDPRPEPVAVDLDALTVPAVPADGLHTDIRSAQHFKVDITSDWCNCGWMAGAHRHDETPHLDVSSYLTPPPSSDPTPN